MLQYRIEDRMRAREEEGEAFVSDLPEILSNARALELARVQRHAVSAQRCEHAAGEAGLATATLPFHGHDGRVRAELLDRPDSMEVLAGGGRRLEFDRERV